MCEKCTDVAAETADMIEQSRKIVAGGRELVEQAQRLAKEVGAEDQDEISLLMAAIAVALASRDDVVDAGMDSLRLSQSFRAEALAMAILAYRKRMALEGLYVPFWGEDPAESLVLATLAAGLVRNGVTPEEVEATLAQASAADSVN